MDGDNRFLWDAWMYGRRSELLSNSEITYDLLKLVIAAAVPCEIRDAPI